VLAKYDPYVLLDLSEALDVWRDQNELDCTRPLDSSDVGVDEVNI
jgi:hypothetical protein